jgi:hypothetical protein
VGPETYLPQPNEEIIAACKSSGGRLLPFGNVDPRGISNSSDAPLDLWLRWYTGRGAIGLSEERPT